MPQGSGLVNLTNLSRLSLTDAFMDRSLSIALMFVAMMPLYVIIAKMLMEKVMIMTMLAYMDRLGFQCG